MEEYNHMMGNLKTWLLEVAPDLLLALAVLAVGTAIAFLSRNFVFFMVTRLARVSNNRIAKAAKSKYAHSFASTFSKLVFWTALAIAASMVLKIFGVKIVEEWSKQATEFIPNLLGSLLVVVTGFLLARFIRDFLRETATLTNFGIKKRVPTVIYYGICTVSILIATEQLGIEIGFLTSSILVVLLCILSGGAISFGIGSAPIVTNLLSTYYLKKRIKVGQYIVTQDFSGVISEIGTTCVFIRSPEGIQSIPSKQLNDLRFTIKHARN